MRVFRYGGFGGGRILRGNCHNKGLEIAGMGWLRLVGSIKLQVSFAEYSLFYKALLQRSPII